MECYVRFVAFLTCALYQGGTAADLKCFSCLHQEGTNILGITTDDLTGEAYTTYKAYYDSVTGQSSTKSSLDILVDQGQHCITQPTKEYSCQTFTEPGNVQHCGTVYMKTVSGGEGWARGCIAQTLCDNYNKTYISGQSSLTLSCCAGDLCNGEDLSTGSSSSGANGEDLSTSSPSSGANGEDLSTGSPTSGANGEDLSTSSPTSGAKLTSVNIMLVYLGCLLLAVIALS